MLKWLSKKRNQKGFTLIELVVVIAILGILAALAIPRFSGMRGIANEGVVVANIRTIQSGIELYAASINTDPSSVAIAHDATVDSTPKKEIIAILGSWPSKPGAITYGVVGGKAEAKIPATLPFTTLKGADDIVTYDEVLAKP